MIVVAFMIGGMMAYAVRAELLVFVFAAIALLPMLSSFAMATVLTVEHKTGRAVLPAHRRMMALAFCVSLFYAIPPSLIPGGGGFLLTVPLFMIGIAFFAFLALKTLRKDAPLLDRRCSKRTVWLAWMLAALAGATIVSTHVLTWGQAIPMFS